MSKLPKIVNIVLLAEKHNPSIVTKDWLENKGIIKNIKDFANIPVFSMAKSDNLELVVDSDRLQLSLIHISADNIKSLAYTVVEYIKALPETRYKAIGFNFSYEIETDIRLDDIFKPDKSIFEKLFSKNFGIGGIVFFNFNGLLSRINFQPVDDKKIIINFNFHFNSNDKNKLRKKLDQHVSIWVKTDEILKELFNV